MTPALEIALHTQPYLGSPRVALEPDTDRIIVSVTDWNVEVKLYDRLDAVRKHILVAVTALMSPGAVIETEFIDVAPLNAEKAAARRDVFDPEMITEREAATRRYFLEKGLAPDKIAAIMLRRAEGIAQARRSREELRHLKALWGPFFYEVRSIVNRHDLLGLVALRQPYGETEYETLVRDIILQLDKAGGAHDVGRIVDDRFRKGFGQASLDHPEYQKRFKGIGANIWDAWGRYSPQ